MGEKESSVDIATEQNLNELVKVGEALLKKPVSRVNLETGVCEPSHEVTNEEALRRFVPNMVRKIDQNFTTIILKSL